MFLTLLKPVALSVALLMGAHAPKDHCRPKVARLVQTTYPVADLVIPVGSAELGENRHAPHETTEKQLMRLLQSAIAPETWADCGGRGTVHYYPNGVLLVVNQTPEVQEQVAELLGALRRLQDVQVAVEIRLLSVSESFAADECFKELKANAFLNYDQILRLMGAAQGDRRVNIMQAPRVTVFNGQNANVAVTVAHHFVTAVKAVSEGNEVYVTPKTEVVPTGIWFSARPIVSADRRTVRLDLHAKLQELDSTQVPLMEVTTHVLAQNGEQGNNALIPYKQFVQVPQVHTLQVDKAFRVADGATAGLCWGTHEVETRAEAGASLLSQIPYVNRLFTNVGYGRERQTLFLLVTPRIIVNEEEEQVFQGELPPRPRP
jgi:type II secretory pathway component GspD/PulD (secretin)